MTAAPPIRAEADPSAPPARQASSERSSPAAVVVAVAGFLLLGTRQSFTVPFTGLGLPLAQLLLLLLALAWLATRLLGQRAPAGLGLLTALLVVRVGADLITYGLAATRVLTPAQQDGADRGLGTELFAVVVVFVMVTVLRSRREIELVLRGLLAGGALSAIFALIQYVGGPDIAASLRPPGFTELEPVLVTALLREGLVRTQGAAAHPLELGAVSALLVPIGIGLVLAARRRGARAWPWALATALIAAGGAVSLSRSTFLGIAIALLVMVPRWPVRRLVNVVVVITLAVIAGGFAVPRLFTALLQVFTQGSDDYSLQSRADGRGYVWSHFADHFWFGQGIGTYDVATQPVLDNQYLTQLMETGVVGLVLLVAVTVCALGYAWRAGRRTVPGPLGELGRGVAGALGAVLVVSFVIDTAGFVALFTLIYLLIGLAAALWRTTTGGIGGEITPAVEPAR